MALFFFFLASHAAGSSAPQRPFSHTEIVFDDAEGDDDDHASGCVFGSKFDMLTHDTRHARVGDATLGRCTL